MWWGDGDGNANRMNATWRNEEERAAEKRLKKLEGLLDGAVGRERRRGGYGEVIPSARIHVSIDSRTRVC